MAKKNENAHKYMRTSVQTASREQLIVMLFDGAVNFAETAREYMTKNEVEAASTRIIRVQDILLELIVSLDRKAGGQIASNLAALYGYLYMRLVEANTKQDPAILDEVIRHLQNLRDTWKQAAEIYRQEQTGAASAKPPEASLSVEG
jgi:flagellar secretion chaperone FliS